MLRNLKRNFRWEGLSSPSYLWMDQFRSGDSKELLTLRGTFASKTYMPLTARSICIKNIFSHLQNSSIQRTEKTTKSFYRYVKQEKKSGHSDDSRKQHASYAESDFFSLIWHIFAVGVGAVSYILFNSSNNGLPLSSCDSESGVTLGLGGVSYETGQSYTNWSSTHTCSPAQVYEPANAQEVARVLEAHHGAKRKIRPIGTALSPNGIGMSSSSTGNGAGVDTNLLSLAALDYVEVDKARGLVTVGAGARVADVLKELKKHGMTLENFSSIQEQQMGGWTQVAAHGTGCSLPTVDEMIVRMKLATPTEGLMTLSHALNPRIFSWAKVGLGSLGVVTELTLRCIPQHQLLEHMFTTTTTTTTKAGSASGTESAAEPSKDGRGIEDLHYERLAHFRHVRYMWLPYTSKVVAVVSNPAQSTPINRAHWAAGKEEGRAGMAGAGVGTVTNAGTAAAAKVAEADVIAKITKGKKMNSKLPTHAMVDLLLSLQPGLSRTNVQKMSFAQLRDALLDIAPLDIDHVKKVNLAEAAFWENSTGSRQLDSTEILGFDCGGEQWVLEVCFPIGSLAEQSGKDLQFVRRLLHIIEGGAAGGAAGAVAAPCPIEQRWTARSTAPMSPAYSEREDEIFSWVGVIMYLPPGQSEAQRSAIYERFRAYTQLMQPLLEEYKARTHWAKIELPYRRSDIGNSTALGAGAGAGITTVSSTELAAQAIAAADSSSSRVPAALKGTCPSWMGTADVAHDSSRYGQELTYMRETLARRYPVEEFNQYRQALDPNFILSNELIDALFNKK